MSLGKVCDGCGELIDTEREQWIEIKVTQERSGLIGKHDDSFPVKEKKLHFHANNTNAGKDCTPTATISLESLGRKVNS